jgi:hypothetical protein
VPHSPQGRCAFGASEEAALQRLFGFDAPQLAALLDGAAAAFRRAAADGANPQARMRVGASVRCRTAALTRADGAHAAAQALADQIAAAGGSADTARAACVRAGSACALR